jgi:hypothetical protein
VSTARSAGRVALVILLLGIGAAAVLGWRLSVLVAPPDGIDGPHLQGEGVVAVDEWLAARSFDRPVHAIATAATAAELLADHVEPMRAAGPRLDEVLPDVGLERDYLAGRASVAELPGAELRAELKPHLDAWRAAARAQKGTPPPGLAFLDGEDRSWGLGGAPVAMRLLAQEAIAALGAGDAYNAGAACLDGLAIGRDAALSGPPGGLASAEGLGWLFEACGQVFGRLPLDLAENAWGQLATIDEGYPERSFALAGELAAHLGLGGAFAAAELPPALAASAAPWVGSRLARANESVDALPGLGEAWLARKGFVQVWPAHVAALRGCAARLEQHPVEGRQLPCLLPPAEPEEGEAARAVARLGRGALEHGGGGLKPSDLLELDDRLRLADARRGVLRLALALSVVRARSADPPSLTAVQAQGLIMNPRDPRSDLSVLFEADPAGFTLRSPAGDLPWIPERYPRAQDVVLRVGGAPPAPPSP